MEVKNCVLSVIVTLQYHIGPPVDLPIRLNIIEGDDILDLIKREVSDYLNVTGGHREYQSYRIAKMNLVIINKETTCRGCLEDQPNQQAHAQFPGDCLYSSSPS